MCAICWVDPETGRRGSNSTTRICLSCRVDPANIDWVESLDDRSTGDERLGFMEEFLFQNIRRIVREEIKRALREWDARVQASQSRSPAGDEYLSIAEAAKIARLHHSTIREWVKDGTLAACRAGRVFRIRRSDLDRRLGAEPEAKRQSRVDDAVSAILARQAARAVG
jgi:excisionase family DNA binding protein